MVRNLVKFFVVCFNVLFWALTLHKTRQKYKRWLCVLINLTNRDVSLLRLCNSCRVKDLPELMLENFDTS